MMKTSDPYDIESTKHMNNVIGLPLSLLIALLLFMVISTIGTTSTMSYSVNFESNSTKAENYNIGVTVTTSTSLVLYLFSITHIILCIVSRNTTKILNQFPARIIDGICILYLGIFIYNFENYDGVSAGYTNSAYMYIISNFLTILSFGALMLSDRYKHNVNTVVL